jgi:hypothetical protein
MLYDDTTASETFELYGPRNYSTAEIAELVDREIIKRRRHVNVPKALLKPTAYYLNKYIWWPTISADEVEREYIDQKIDHSAKTFKDIDIEPAELSTLTFDYLVCPTLASIKCPFGLSLTFLYRRATGVPPTMICPHPLIGRGTKKRSTSMSWTTSS